ncbi:MAG: hypothetical protein ACRD9S_05850 [Pyrinomonadaceae bacterium]
MAKKDRQTIAEIVRKTYGKAKLYETALNASEYDLDVVPLPRMNRCPKQISGA